MRKLFTKIAVIATLGLASLVSGLGCTTINSYGIAQTSRTYGTEKYNFRVREIDGKKHAFLEIPEGKTAKFGDEVYNRNSLEGSLMVPLDAQEHRIRRGLITQVEISPTQNPYFLAPVVTTERGRVRLAKPNEAKPSKIEITLPEKFRKMEIQDNKVEVPCPYEIVNVILNLSRNVKERRKIFAEIKTTDTIEGFTRLPVMYVRYVLKPETLINTQEKTRRDFIEGTQYVPVQGELVDIPKPIEPAKPVLKSKKPEEKKPKQEKEPITATSIN